MKSVKLFKLLLEVKRLWIASCKHDKIEPDAFFVVFSKDNPFIGLYNKAMADYLLMKGAACSGVRPAGTLSN
jgi:hypothetical protein